MRWAAPAVAATLAVLLAACSNPLDEPPSSDRIPAGCGTCEPEVAALTRTLQRIPGVDDVRGSTLTKRGVPVAHLSVGLELTGTDVVSTDLESVADAVAEAAWRSDVSPLDVLTLHVDLPDGYGEVDSYQFGAERAAYERRWGARPKGSEWSPVPPADDDLEGCEVDGCTDLMRAIARTASAVDGVGTVLESSYVGDSPTDDAHATIEVTSSGGDPATIAEAVAELVWRSEVTPIDRIAVSVHPPGGGIAPSTDFDVGPGDPDRSALEEKWGPRPVG